MQSAVKAIVMGVRQHLLSDVLPEITDQGLKSTVGMACDLLGQTVLSAGNGVVAADYEDKLAALANGGGADADARAEEVALHNAYQAGLAPTPAVNKKARLTVPAMQDYLRAHVPGFGGAVVEAVKTIPGGFSKDTFQIVLEQGSGAHDRLIMRRDLPAGPGETKVADEYRILKPLFDMGFPVAEPVALETDTEPFAEAFMLGGFVEGDEEPLGWQKDPEHVAAIGAQLARLLAELHTTDPATLDMTRHVGLTPPQAVEAELEHWKSMWQRRHWLASPTLDVAFDWLLTHVPDTIPTIGVVHADVGFHNTIVRDGEIRALLDWEFSHAGDPAEDLGYARQFIEPLMGWDDFLSHYRAAGGPEISFDNAPFYELWRFVRNAVCCAVAMDGFVRGESHDLRMAFEGTTFYRMFVAMVNTQLMRLGVS